MPSRKHTLVRLINGEFIAFEICQKPLEPNKGSTQCIVPKIMNTEQSQSEWAENAKKEAVGEQMDAPPQSPTQRKAVLGLWASSSLGTLRRAMMPFMVSLSWTYLGALTVSRAGSR